MSTNLKGTHLALLRLEVATFESHGPGWLARSDIIALVRVPLPIDEVFLLNLLVFQTLSLQGPQGPRAKTR